jgi:serine protease Do
MRLSNITEDHGMKAGRMHRRSRFVHGVGAALFVALACLAPATALADENDSVFAEALSSAQPRCVKLYGAGTNVEAGYATGLIVSDDGLILTAQGIYLAGDRLRAVLADGSAYDTTLVRRSEPLQAALLKIDAKTPDYFPLAKEPIGEKGDWVLAVSNLFKVAANKEQLSANLGVISLRTRVDARHRTQDVPYDAEMLLVDAITSNPGASGGAVIDMDGRLVGMIGKLLESKNTNTRINYAVPADLLYKFVRNEPIEAVATNPPPTSTGGGKATLGVRMFTFAGKRSPAYVDGIVPGSPAATIGLKRDDLIMQIDGETVRNLRDYERIVETLRPGAEVTIIVKRKQDVLSFQITPDAEK